MCFWNKLHFPLMYIAAHNCHCAVVYTSGTFALYHYNLPSHRKHDANAAIVEKSSSSPSTQMFLDPFIVLLPSDDFLNC